MKLKPLAKYCTLFTLGATVGAGVVWKNAVNEHARLMNLESNKAYIEELSGIDTGVNPLLSSRTNLEATVQCATNAQKILYYNGIADREFSIYGWKSYVQQGMLVYLDGPSTTSKGQDSAFVCILNSGGELEVTKLLYPLPDGDPVISMGEPSFLEIKF